MPLDPHIRRILDMLAAAGAADASRLTLGERREAFRKLMSLSESNVAVGHAAELRIDPDRIAVGGDSAGGTLAAIVCQLARQARGVRLAAQLLLCPITDFAADTESRCAFAEGYLLHKATLDRDLEHYVPAGLNPADPCVSPLRAPDFRGLPPAYIHTAEFDQVRDEGRAYADRLAQAGI